MTLENVVEYLNADELADLCFCLNNFGDRSTGVYANETNVGFYRFKYANECIRRALQSNKINDLGILYIQKLQARIEELINGECVG
jgi:hypothetical protein